MENSKILFNMLVHSANIWKKKQFYYIIIHTCNHHWWLQWWVHWNNMCQQSIKFAQIEEENRLRLCVCCECKCCCCCCFFSFSFRCFYSVYFPAHTFISIGKMVVPFFFVVVSIRYSHLYYVYSFVSTRITMIFYFFRWHCMRENLQCKMCSDG